MSEDEYDRAVDKATQEVFAVTDKHFGGDPEKYKAWKQRLIDEGMEEWEIENAISEKAREEPKEDPRQQREMRAFDPSIYEGYIDSNAEVGVPENIRRAQEMEIDPLIDHFKRGNLQMPGENLDDEELEARYKEWLGVQNSKGYYADKIERRVRADVADHLENLEVVETPYGREELDKRLKGDQTILTSTGEYPVEHDTPPRALQEILDAREAAQQREAAQPKRTTGLMDRLKNRGK